MTKERGKFRTATIGAGILLILAVVAAVIYIPIYISNVRDTAYEKGTYDHAYGILEGEWDESRETLVHASLAASVCTEQADAESLCELLVNSRSRLSDMEMPARISDGNADDYSRAALQADSDARRIDAHQRSIDRAITAIERYSELELWESIDLTAGLVPIALDALAEAETAVADGTASSDVIEAKEELEAILAQYEVDEFPTGWDSEDISQAFDELNTATSTLQIAL